MVAEPTTEVRAAGDEVGRLYTEYGARLRRFCRGRLRSTEEAEDAVQTTFLRVYTALRQGTVPRYEAAWLYKIAHNVCLSRIEASARRARLESPQDLARLEDEPAAPEGRSDDLVGLADALAGLPPNLRQAILLREWQGLSYAEISEALGVSVSAVESLIFRARRRLASALVEPGKRIAGALNVPWLAGTVRSLPAGLRADGAGAGLGARVAAGVALLAVGGGGAGLGLAVGAPAHRARPVVTVRPAAAGFSPAGATVRARAPHGEMAVVAATITTASRPRAAPSGRTVGVVAQTTAVRAAPAAPPAAPAPPVPVPAGPAAPRDIPPRTTAPPATTPAGPVLPEPPAVTVPAVQVPAIPAVTVPSLTVTVPPVTAPALPVSVPAVTLPAITTPTVTLP